LIDENSGLKNKIECLEERVEKIEGITSS